MGGMSEVVVKAVSISMMIIVEISMMRIVMPISVLSMESVMEISMMAEIAMVAESAVTKSMINSMLFMSVIFTVHAVWVSIKAMSILEVVWMVLLMSKRMRTIPIICTEIPKIVTISLSHTVRALLVVVHRCVVWGIVVSHVGSQCIL